MTFPLADYGMAIGKRKAAGAIVVACRVIDDPPALRPIGSPVMSTQNSPSLMLSRVPPGSS